MKHRTIAIVLFAALLLFLMVWSFDSSAASGSRRRAQDNSVAASEASAPAQAEGTADKDKVEGDEQDVDADLGKLGSRPGIDREEYLRLRDEYVARKRGIEPGRPFDPSLRGRAIEQMDRQEENRKIESLVNGSLTPPIGVDATWTPIGPSTFTNGQSLSGEDIAVSGRVTSIAVDPTNANKVYLGTAQGGVWRSLDGGSTWASIFDNAQSQAIGALALAPSDPTILYVGTGESNGCRACFFGVGIYRIDTVDTTPTLVGPINPLETISNLTYRVFNGRGISRIVVDPTNPATIFVAMAHGGSGIGNSALSSSVPALATRGVYRSTNATAALDSITFQKLVVTTDGSVAGESPKTGDVDVTDIAIEPGVPNNLLVAVIGATFFAGGLYRTTNALAANPTFNQVYAAPLGTRLNLTINKVGTVVTAYAATSEMPDNATGCSSSVSGTVQKQVDPFNVVAFSKSSTWGTDLTGGKGFCGFQCGYDIAIAVNPNNANEVYLGGNARFEFPAIPCPDGMKKSIDGGATFVRDDQGLHADAHALAYDAAGNTIFAGNDGGVWKRAASAAPATPWTNLNKSPLNTLQFEGIGVHPTDRYLMIGGTQDNGTEYQQGSAGNWSSAEGGDGGYCLIDQSATNTINVTMYHTYFNAKNSLIGFDRIVNTACLANKNSWPQRGAGFGPSDSTPVACDGGTPYVAANGLNLTDNVIFYAPMTLGPGSPNTFYFGTDRLYRSTDRGDTMTVVSQGPISQSSPGPPPVGSPISTIAISPQDDNCRLVGLQDGEVWATSMGSPVMVNLTSASFPANPTGSTTNKFVGRAAIDPNNPNVAYIAFSFYAPPGLGIWKITNLAAAAGASPVPPNWVPAGSGLPSIPINALAIDPANSNTIYAGTDVGVYYSTDAGSSWTPFGRGLPRVAVFDMALQNANRILRVATHGRGIWEIAVNSVGASNVQFSAANYTVGEGAGNVSITVTRTGDVRGTATVVYATGDSAGAQSCNTISSIASSRCDYLASIGTVEFGANESSKSFSIPIVDDTYVEGGETFTLTLSGSAGATLGPLSSTTVTITDNDSVSGQPNQIDTSSYFVREHYIDFLNREPDTPGLNFWTDQIESCNDPARRPPGQTQAQCSELRRINTSAAFFISVEFQETGYLVYRFYKSAYGDAVGVSTLGGAHNLPVPVIRLNEFVPDTQRIGQGVIVNAGNWQQQLEDNKQAFAEEFVQRSRFLTAYPLTLTPAQFVDGLNTKAGNALSTAERDQLVSDLTAGIKTRGQALRALAEDSTLYNAEYNRAFVLMQYFGYLRRNPNDPQDSDYTGYDFWLGKLNQFGGNFVNAEMVKSFLVSGEYRQRFGP